MHVYKLHIWKYRFNMIKYTCFFPLVASQSLLPQSPCDSRTVGCRIMDTMKTNNVSILRNSTPNGNQWLWK
jgi:hypothetical protein